MTCKGHANTGGTRSRALSKSTAECRRWRVVVRGDLAD